MTRWKTVAIAAVVAGSWAVRGLGADVRVATLDMDRVLQAFPETKASRTVLEKQLEEYEAEQKQMLVEREKLLKEVTEAREAARNEALSATAREKQLADLEAKVEDLRKYEREIRETANQRQRMLSDQRTRMQRRIVARIREIVKAYCEKEHIDMALDSGSMGAQGVETVLYSHERMDVTDAIVALVSKEAVRAPEPVSERKTGKETKSAGTP